MLFNRRDVSEWSALDASRFRVMLLASLTTAFLAVLPLPLFKLNVPSDLLWSVSSAVLAVGLVGGAVVHFRARRLFASAILLWLVYQIAFWVAFVVQLLNIGSVGYHREAGPYIFGLSWLLFQAGWQFYRLVLPPGRPAA